MPRLAHQRLLQQGLVASSFQTPLAPEHAALVRNADGLGATVIYGGQVIGTWTRETKRAELVIHARPFTAWMGESLEAVERAAEQYGAFHEKRAVVKLKDT